MDLQRNLHHDLYVLGSLTHAYRNALANAASRFANAASPLASITVLKTQMLQSKRQGTLSSKHRGLTYDF